MIEKDHFCEYEVAGELIFCAICGEMLHPRGDAQ
jgi:hypothetical protein